MRSSLQRETIRLGRLFGALVLVTAPLAAAQACSSSPDGVDAPDASSPIDSASDPDTSVVDVSAPETRPSFDAACAVLAEQLDAGADVDPPCRYTLPCGVDESVGFVIQGCEVVRKDPIDGDASLGCAVPAVYGCENDAYAPPLTSSFTFECKDCLGGSGRRPNGLLRASTPRATSAVGAWFATMAHGEAASVHAFVRMREELVRFGAPRALIEGATRAIEDETRHARMMNGQAARHGAIAEAARVRRRRPRSIDAMALENAVEGCIRETFGALVLRFQSVHASDPTLRRFFARIAADETRHAALSAEVARWIDERLGTKARARVASAKRSAIRSLERSIRSRTPSALDQAVGQPAPVVALALLAGLTR